MELGKLVTSERGGGIYYFIIDEVHPDEPHQDALKYYYVVAAGCPNFDYRDAYCVLCRALCDLHNRTFLHRWHALYEQIFGTTPYVQFVDAVRSSPHVAPDRDDGVGDAACSSAASQGEAAGLSSRGDMGALALFSTEASARVALRRMTSKMRLNAPAEKKGATRDAAHETGKQPSCCTPVATRHRPTSAVPPRPNTTGPSESAAPAPPPQPPAGPAPVTPDATAGIGLDLARPTQKVTDLLDVATRWKPSSSPLTEVEPARAIHDLQRQLRQERERRLEAERHHDLLSRLLEQRQRRGSDPNTAAAPVSVAAAAPSPSPSPHTTDAEQRRLLQAELAELRQALSDERRQYATRCDTLLAETEQLKAQLVQQSREQSARIEQFVRDNGDAVKRVETALQKREDEVRAVYTQALQERDVRIAQLSQEVLQHTHESRHATQLRADEERLHSQRVAHLEDVAGQLWEWNGSLQGQLADATAEVRRLRQRLDVAESATFAAVGEVGLSCSVCGGLPRVHAVQLAAKLHDTQLELQTCRQEAHASVNELCRAAQLIDALKEGLRRVKLDLQSGSGTHAQVCSAALAPHQTLPPAQAVS